VPSLKKKLGGIGERSSGLQRGQSRGTEDISVLGSEIERLKKGKTNIQIFVNKRQKAPPLGRKSKKHAQQPLLTKDGKGVLGTWDIRRLKEG